MTNIERLDGRTARRLGNRDRMLKAGLKLIGRTGNYRITAQEVTDEAAMHPRSFHMIFGNVEGFFEALAEEHSTSVHELIKRDVKDKDKSLARLVLCGR